MESVDFSVNQQYLKGRGAGGSLQIGVLIESLSVPRFVHAVLADIAACDFAAIACAFLESEHNASNLLSWSGPGLPAPLAAYYHLYDRRERRLPDALESVDTAPLLVGVPRVSLYGPQQEFGVPCRRDALDLILCFGSRASAQRLAPLARHGAWFIEYGSTRVQDIASALLSDFSRDEILFPVRLVGISSDGAAHKLTAEMVLSTRSRVAMADNVSSVVWSLQHMFIQTLHKFHAGTLSPRRTARALSASTTEPASKTAPLGSALRATRWIAAAGSRRIFRRILRGARRIEWQIAIRRSTRTLVENATSAALRDFRWLRAEPGHFWADPFLFEAGGDVWLFYEDYPYATGRAVISCGRLLDDGSLTDTRVAVDRPYHLSYPQVFEWDGAVWMIPETAGSGRVELYRCVRFPDAWILEKTLLCIRATDTTIAQVDGLWWLFVSPLPVLGQTATTLLYCSDSPLGPWTEVAASPVCTDVQAARGAGRIFPHRGALIRPSQNCAMTYGYSIRFNRIDTLTQQRFAECAVGTVLPHGVAGVQRVHTYSCVKEWEAIDAFRYADTRNV